MDMTSPKGMVRRSALAAAEKGAKAMARQKRAPYSCAVWLFLFGLAAALAISTIFSTFKFAPPPLKSAPVPRSLEAAVDAMKARVSRAGMTFGPACADRLRDVLAVANEVATVKSPPRRSRACVDAGEFEWELSTVGTPRLAAVVLTQGGPNTRRLLRALKGWTVVVHLDAAQPQEIADALIGEGYDVIRKVRVHRGGESMLQATLEGMSHLLDQQAEVEDYDFVAVLSESHFPIRSPRQLARFFDMYRGMSFVGVHGHVEAAGYLPRIQPGKPLLPTVECAGRVWVVNQSVPRASERPLIYASGPQWVVLSSDVVDAVAQWREPGWVRDVYRRARAFPQPDESFFQMLALEMCAPLVPVPMTFSGPAHEEHGGDLGEVPVLSPSFVNYDATQVKALQERLPVFVRKVNGTAAFQDLLERRADTVWNPCPDTAAAVFRSVESAEVLCRQEDVADEFGAVVVQVRVSGPQGVTSALFVEKWARPVDPATALVRLRSDPKAPWPSPGLLTDLPRLLLLRVECKAAGLASVVPSACGSELVLHWTVFGFDLQVDLEWSLEDDDADEEDEEEQTTKHTLPMFERSARVPVPEMVTKPRGAVAERMSSGLPIRWGVRVFARVADASERKDDDDEPDDGRVLMGARTFAVFDASRGAVFEADGELVDLRDEFFEQEDSLLDLF